MNDPDNFLGRWSRRKRGHEPDDSQAEKPKERSNDRTVPPPEPVRQATPKDKVAVTPRPEFDVSSLPPIESIGAGTDISVFMQAGVPSVLRHAALRRAWSADPAIRDFMGPTENYWDAAGPDGIPGFGELDPSFDVRRMVSELFGETGPKEARPESNPTDAPEHFAENSEAPDRDRDGKSVTSESEQVAPQRTENGAPQKDSTQTQPLQKVARRHGGAMPE